MGPRQAERSRPPPRACSPSDDPLQGRAESDGDLETGGEPEPPRNCKRLTVALTIVFLGLIIAVIVLAVQRYERPPADLGPPGVPCCPDSWVGYQGRCYYFSKTEGNWNDSLTNCSALSASLAWIDSAQDMAFLLRYKGKLDHWIGLWRDPGQPWKWANGTEFNNLFAVRGGGDCGYLNDENGVSSSRCTNERHWICTKPDEFTKAKEDAMEGG